MNFEIDVLKKSSAVNVIADFSAEWCGPCKIMKPLLKRIIGQRDDYELVIVDVDKEREVSIQYGIRAVPSVIMFKNGIPVSKYVGGFSPTSVNEWLNAFSTVEKTQ